MGGIDNECCRRERFKYALYRQFREPRLYRLASKGDWGPIPQRCLTHPKEVEFIHQYAPSDTALHQILRFPSLELTVDSSTQHELEKSKTDAISALLNTHRSIASISDSYWKTPLHLACMDIPSCGETAFNLILEACPEAASRQDMEGRTPLHYLVARNECVPPRVLEKLFSTCPSAVTVRDLVKETPIDIIASRRGQVQNADQVVKLLQEVDAPPLTNGI